MQILQGITKQPFKHLQTTVAIPHHPNQYNAPKSQVIHAKGPTTIHSVTAGLKVFYD